MKLHNLITDEICEAEAREDGIYVKANWPDEGKWFLYDLHTLASCWEYYVEPKKPLIKDEKVRKAVRAWADANVHTLIQYNIAKDCLYFLSGTDYSDTSISISFDEVDVFKELEHRRTYSLAELCGEEE
jgi:hypothetical protein